MNWAVYEHISPSGKVYIGITSNIKKRWASNGYYYQLKDTIFARAIKRSLGPQSEDPTSRLNFFKDQMEYYKAQLVTGGLPTIHYAYPKTFRKGMHSNPPWPEPRGGKYVR